jgi:hypothetical protein
MRFLLDENVSFRVAGNLKAAGLEPFMSASLA